MIGRLRTGHGIAALVAGLLLVLQSALASVAMGAEPVQRDIFGNVICIAGRASENPAHDGGHVPDCCLLGCTAGIHGAADMPGAIAEITAPRSHTAARFPEIRDAFVFAAQRRQGNPRAPPVAA